MGELLEAYVGLSGIAQEVRGRAWATDRTFRFPWPGELSADDLNAARADFEVIAEKFREHPKEMLAIQTALVEKDFRTGIELAAKIGLTEAEFEARGGGCFYYVVIWSLFLIYGMYGYGYGEFGSPGFKWPPD